MVGWILKKILGSKNQRELRRLAPIVRRVNELDEQFKSLSDDELRAKTAAWKEEFSKIPELEDQWKKLNEILPEAFAVVKNAARRLKERQHSFTVCDQPMVWDMVHFDVQLLGGVVLHRGRIAEMATGEGKTLVATLPLYLSALTGRGAHLVTVNDYLARRDAEWMGQLYDFLGLTVGCIEHDQEPDVRREQYAMDITYGTNSEFGFDYLRDNGMATTREQQVQRGYHYAIVDEVDSILIDEARTPLIISGPTTISTHQYDKWKPLIEQLVRKQNMLCNRLASEAAAKFEEGDIEIGGRLMFKVKLGQPRNKQLLRMMEDPDKRRAIDKAELSFYQDTRREELFRLKEEMFFTIDEKSNEADLSEQGRTFLNPDDPNAFVLPDLINEFTEIDLDTTLSDEEKDKKKSERQQHCDEQAERIHNISNLLRAYCVFDKDVQYVVEKNKIVIVDEFTGRKMPGRRWSDGLHQAIEAKEGVEIQEENQTLATISYQNFFRIYKKLAGMTGTADTEAEEFHKIYKLDVVVVPTNRGMKRLDHHDVVYKNEKGKFRALCAEIEESHKRGQPVLVGTVSVEKSEVVASILRKKNIPHNVLNAKQHEREAFIVAQAGKKGAVTISTNMAGRGTDIILGGNPEFLARAEVDPENAGKPGHELAPEKQAGYEEALARFKAQCDAEKKEVLAAGGLHILGTERHESRRIDNQLRGRSGRQGDPGSSRFFLSLEDDLMRIFGAERITGLMETLGMEEDVPIEHSLINRAIENAQKKVEGHNFDIRKNLLEYDDVMNQQRKTIYALRRQILEGRYAPEPTEAERKAGKTAVGEVPSASGAHTVETLSRR